MRKLLVVLALTMASLAIPTSAEAATTQHGCTFDVPKVSQNGKNAKATIKVKCNSMGAGAGLYSKRQVVVDVKGDDGVTSHVVDWRAAGLATPWSSGTLTKTYSDLKCNEDGIGDDEIFLTVRIEAYSIAPIGGGWKKGTAIRGATTTSLKC